MYKYLDYLISQKCSRSNFPVIMKTKQDVCRFLFCDKINTTIMEVLYYIHTFSNKIICFDTF